MNVDSEFWGAHAPRVLAMAPSPSEILLRGQVRFGEGAKTSTRGACAPQNSESTFMIGP